MTDNWKNRNNSRISGLCMFFNEKKKHTCRETKLSPAEIKKCVVELAPQLETKPCLKAKNYEACDTDEAPEDMCVEEATPLMKAVFSVEHNPIGRCKFNPPTLQGFPVVFALDWCGQFKLDENKL